MTPSSSFLSLFLSQHAETDAFLRSISTTSAKSSRLHHHRTRMREAAGENKPYRSRLKGALTGGRSRQPAAPRTQFEARLCLRPHAHTLPLLPSPLARLPSRRLSPHSPADATPPDGSTPRSCQPPVPAHSCSPLPSMLAAPSALKICVV